MPAPPLMWQKVLILTNYKRSAGQWTWIANRSLGFDGCANLQILRLRVKRRRLSKGENIIHFLSPYTPVLDPDEFREIETRVNIGPVKSDRHRRYFNKTIAKRKGVVAYKERDKYYFESLTFMVCSQAHCKSFCLDRFQNILHHDHT